MQFALSNISDPSASPEDSLRKLASTIGIGADDDDDDEELAQAAAGDLDEDEEDEDLDGKEDETSEETDDASKPEKAEKRKTKLRLKRLRRKTMTRAYEFSGGSDVVGIIFLDINRITDLPPERNGKLTLQFLYKQQLTSWISNKDIFRYGPIRSSFNRAEDIQDSSYPSQLESCFRGENGLPSHATRAELFHELLGSRP